MAFTAPTDESLTVNLAGTATDDIGLESVRVSLQERDTGRYLQANGTMAATIAYRNATLNPAGGRRRCRPRGRCHRSRCRPEATGASRRSRSTLPTGSRTRVRPPATYQVYPNDGPPSLSRHPRAAAERRLVRRRQDRRHRTRGGRAGRQREHRRGRDRDRELRRAVHELVGHVHQHDAAATGRRSSTAPAALGRTTRTRRRSFRPGPTASTCGLATSWTSSATTTR